MSGKPGTRIRPNPHTDDTPWQNHAACQNADPNMFFDPGYYHIALLLCRECPVTQQCRKLGRNQEGVWGGHIHRRKRKEAHQ